MAVDRFDHVLTDAPDLIEKRFYRLRPGLAGMSTLHDEDRLVVLGENVQLTRLRPLAGLDSELPRSEGVEHLIEESRRQKAVIVAVAVRKLAEIVARPGKFIAFGDHDPGRVIVEPEMPIDRHRNLDR
jgi:hypothetical protein